MTNSSSNNQAFPTNPKDIRKVQAWVGEAIMEQVGALKATRPVSTTTPGEAQAQPISAVRARELGILNHLVEPDALEAFTYELVTKIVENSPLAIRVLKEQLRVLGNSYPMSPETQERIQGLRRMVYQSSDYSEGKAAFLEKRKPHYSN
jgi:1,4-dihydroxy-2-naphthoyl-CoA synthase